MAKHISDIHLPTNASIAAGAPAPEASTAKPTEAHIEAINHLFTELELAYHNQFHKAFPDHQSLSMAKQLWLRLLVDFKPKHIAAAGRQAICDNTFLPTPHSIREYCDAAVTAGIPDAQTAYIEASLSSEPRQNVKWSHPIVYYAGKITDWFFISSQPEAQVFPVFERNYLLLLERVKRGETLSLPVAKALTKKKQAPLEPEVQKEKLKNLREQLDL
jgi:hypothetical protein